ncbi:MAG: mycofactocin precursor MftA [Acidimicrobiales bacterium]
MKHSTEQLHGGPAVALATREDDEVGHERDGDLDLILDDVLVEDVSIDGMCGVY